MGLRWIPLVVSWLKKEDVFFGFRVFKIVGETKEPICALKSAKPEPTFLIARRGQQAIMTQEYERHREADLSMEPF